MNWDEVIIAEVTGIIRVHNEEGGKLIMSGRRDSALIFPLKGKIRFGRNDRSVIADRTHPVMIFQGAYYVNECLESAESLMINFVLSGQQEEEWIQEIPAVDTAYAADAFDRMQLLSARKRPENRCMLLAEMYRLMGGMLKGPTEEGERLLGPAIALIMEKYSDPDLSGADLAEASRISQPYLRKLFKAHMGTTPIRYLTGVRMEKARSLLTEGWSVRETALSVGYGDIYQFSRAFRNLVGCPPVRYAQKSRATDAVYERVSKK